MAMTVTFTGVGSRGNRKELKGTFTTATGDYTGSIDTGLTVIDEYKVTLKGAGLNTPELKTSVSNATVNGRITVTTDDFQGYSGSFWAVGA